MIMALIALGSSGSIPANDNQKKIRLIAKCSMLVLLSIGLSNCAAYQTQSQINSMMEREYAGWEKTEQLKATECPNGTKDKPVPRSQAIERYECWARLARDNVGPVAVAPDLFMKVVTDNKQIAINYKKGKIDRDEANLESQKLWNEYYSALVARATNAYRHAQMQDQAFAQRLQNASQAIQAQETVQDDNLITNTNCHVWRNQMNCTTW